MLGELLGRGGMAEVFAGHAVGDHGFQKPVAIKRLLPELANDEVFVERLIEEAKLLVGMQHGNIVSVLDLAREGDDVFLVMEFVDGPSLRQLIKARKTLGLSLGVATYVVQSAAAGLEFAHARPGGAIIHADVSPSNLLLTTSGEVRVADFGIARREGLGQAVVEGKWAYMAPEQARGEPLAPRSDVFALGVVLYELLTGRHPFGAAVTASERDEQMRVIPPRTIKPGVPHGIEAVCMRALAHDPRDRYSRMQQLIDALVEERFANGYREGAADLAQAIREVAPGGPGLEAGPRTMHTDRPLTIVTRSLLADATPARRSRASIPPGRDEAAIPLSVGDQTAAVTTSGYIPVPSSGTHTIARVLDDVVPPPQTLPPSGAYTAVREVDQAAFAQAASALLQGSPLLRADGTPMPPFRLPQPVQGEELASVVGGHTITGHAAGLAIDAQPRRWTLVVLAAAAVIGIIAAIVIQLRPAARSEVAATDVPSVPAVAPTSAVSASPIEPAPAPMPPPPAAPVAAAEPPRATPPVVADPDDQPASPTLRDALHDRAPQDPAPESAPSEPVAADDAANRRAPRSATRDKAVAKVEPGTLVVDATPWSWVTVGSQKRETPGKFKLAPGTHVAKFYCAATGVTKIEPFKIESGERLQLNVEMNR